MTSGLRQTMTWMLLAAGAMGAWPAPGPAGSDGPVRPQKFDHAFGPDGRPGVNLAQARIFCRKEGYSARNQHEDMV